VNFGLGPRRLGRSGIGAWTGLVSCVGCGSGNHFGEQASTGSISGDGACVGG